MTVQDIARAVATHYTVPLARLLSPERSQQIALPRQVTYYLARELLKCSFPAIGKELGRDHTTVILGVRALRKQMLKDRNLRRVLGLLRDRLAPRVVLDNPAAICRTCGRPVDEEAEITSLRETLDGVKERLALLGVPDVAKKKAGRRI